MNKKNPMGSDVVEGYACKPKILDKNKPIMYSALQIFICDGHRCKKIQAENLAEKVRGIVKNLDLDKGVNRVKVTRTLCNGACRFRNFAYVYKNARSRNFNPDNSFMAWKNANTFTDENWKDIIISLLEGKEPITVRDFRVFDELTDPNKNEEPDNKAENDS